MKKVKHLFSGMLAVLAVLLLTGCQWNDNPVRTSLEVEQTDLTLQVGESATRAASTQSKDYEFIYTSSNPAVATVDQNGKVTALTVGETTITVTMPETKVGWYAAATREYKVFVKKVSAAALADVDKSTPLTLVAAENGKITVTFNNGVTLKNDIKYTINGGAEQTIAKNTEGAYDITVKKGDVVQLYSTNTTLGGGGAATARGLTRAVDSSAKYINIKPSMKTEIYGNVMSLLKGKDNLADANAIEGNNAFYGLFAGADKLVNSSERKLMLPATTLKNGCYSEMFSGCASLKTAPELPAPTLTENCYAGMFSGCKKLEAVKILADNVAASGALKDFLTGAGSEAEKKPVVETATALPEGTIPSNFTEAKAVTGIKLSETTLEMTVSDTKPLTATLTPAEATNKTLEWTSSNPAVATVLGDATDNTKATVTAVGAGSATITCSTPDGSVKATCAVTVAANQLGTYIDYSSGSARTIDIPQNVQSINESVTSWAGTYIVEGNKTITGDVHFTGNVSLILLDNSKLTVNGHIFGGDDYGTAKNYTLSIYAQSEGNSMGEFIIDAGNANPGNNGNNIVVNKLTIHGGKVTAKGGDQCFEVFSNDTSTGDIIIYAGKITSTDAWANSFMVENHMYIYGGIVDAKADGIVFSTTNLTINGGVVTATSNNANNSAIYGTDIVISGGTITLSNSGSDTYCATISANNVTITTGITNISLENANPGDNNPKKWIYADTSLKLGSSVADASDVKSSWDAVEVASGNSWGSAVTYGFNVTRNDNTLVLTKAAN